MKRSPYIVPIVLAVVGLVFWFFLKQREGLSVPHESVSSTPPEKGLEPSRFEERRKELFSLLQSNDAEIEFFGRVENENGVPLEGVEVEYSIVKSGSFAPSMGLPVGSMGKVISGADGIFEISGQKGVTLGINSLAKLGYREARRNNRSFSFGDSAEPHQPDKLNPTSFILVKEGAVPPIVKYIPLRFDWDGTPVPVRLSLGGVEEELILTPSRDVVDPGERKYDWSLDIQLAGGQVSLGKHGEAPVAPAEGYSDSVTVRSIAGEPRWTSAANVVIYARTPAGKYCQMKLRAYSDRSESSNTGGLTIAVNPSGGRAFK